MNLQIPLPQTTFTLAAPWTFTISALRQNMLFINTLVRNKVFTESDILSDMCAIRKWAHSLTLKNLRYTSVTSDDFLTITIPSYSQLKVVAVSIKNKPPVHLPNNITLRLLKTPNQNWTNARFLVNIAAFNGIDILPLGTPPIAPNTAVRQAILL